MPKVDRGGRWHATIPRKGNRWIDMPNVALKKMADWLDRQPDQELRSQFKDTALRSRNVTRLLNRGDVEGAQAKVEKFLNRFPWDDVDDEEGLTEKAYEALDTFVNVSPEVFESEDEPEMDETPVPAEPKPEPEKPAAKSESKPAAEPKEVNFKDLMKLDYRNLGYSAYDYFQYGGTGYPEHLLKRGVYEGEPMGPDDPKFGQAALAFYVGEGNGGDYINQALRGTLKDLVINGWKPEERMPEDQQARTLEIAQAAEKHVADNAVELPQDSTLYRGIEAKALEQLDLKPGAKIPMSGLFSTSTSRKIGEDFANRRKWVTSGKPGALIEIETPKGSKVTAAHVKEQELILQPGDLEIVSVDTSGKVPVIRARFKPAANAKDDDKGLALQSDDPKVDESAGFNADEELSEGKPAAKPAQDLRPESDFGIEWPELSAGDASVRTSQLDQPGASKYYDQFSDVEREAMRTYSSGQTFFGMREAYLAGEPYLNADGVDLVDALNGALAKSELTKDTQLFRVMKVDKGWAAGLKAGSQVDHNFFISTTATPRQAKAYGAEKGARGQEKVMIQILAPKGTHGIPGMAGIEEIVLGPDETMTVRRVQELNDMTLVVVDLKPKDGDGDGRTGKAEETDDGGMPQETPDEPAESDPADADAQSEIAGVAALKKAFEEGYSTSAESIWQGKRGSVEIGTLGDGTKVVRKTAPNEEEADKEALIGLVANVFGIDVATAKIGPTELVTHHIQGGTGNEWLRQQMNDADPAEGPGGGKAEKLGRWKQDGIFEKRMVREMKYAKEIGLLDFLTNNPDRHPGNWMVRGDNEVVPIDHGNAMFDPVRMEREGKELVWFNGSPFAKYWLGMQVGKYKEIKSMDPGQHWDKTELQQYRSKLAGLKDQFASRPEWHTAIMANIDNVLEYIK